MNQQANKRSNDDQSFKVRDRDRSCRFTGDCNGGSIVSYGWRKYGQGATDVQYRTYFDDDNGPYTYRPAYRYRGYTYWYPSYGSWVYPGDYYYYNRW
jgi:hypothetical protein